jgi:hypothetical protein
MAVSKRIVCFESIDKRSTTNGYNIVLIVAIVAVAINLDLSNILFTKTRM